jgi:hypothetical protein
VFRKGAEALKEAGCGADNWLFLSKLKMRIPFAFGLNKEILAQRRVAASVAMLGFALSK